MPRKKKPLPPCFRCWFLYELIARACDPEECADLETWLLTVTPIQVDKYLFLECNIVQRHITQYNAPVSKKESWLKRLIKKVV